MISGAKLGAVSPCSQKRTCGAIHSPQARLIGTAWPVHKLGPLHGSGKRWGGFVQRTRRLRAFGPHDAPSKGLRHRPLSYGDLHRTFYQRFYKAHPRHSHNRSHAVRHVSAAATQPTGFVDRMGCRAAPRHIYPAIARIRGQKGAGFTDRKARDNKTTQGRENHTRALKKKASPRIARIRGQKDAGYQGTQGREPQQGSEDRKRRRRAKLNDAFTS